MQIPGTKTVMENVFSFHNVITENKHVYKHHLVSGIVINPKRDVGPTCYGCYSQVLDCWKENDVQLESNILIIN